MFLSAHPASPGGTARDRHERWRQGAVDVKVFSVPQARRRRQLHGRAKACGPDPPTLGSSLCQDVSQRRRWLQSPVHRGERAISRKPSRGECRMFWLNLWYLPPALFVAGGPWVRPAPGIPRALLISRATKDASPGQCHAAGMRTHVPRHRDPSAPRNDGGSGCLIFE